MLPTSTCLSSHPELSLEVFAADERPELAALYLAGQAESLRHHVEAGLRSAPLGDARIVLARDADGTAHGGMRVHLRRSGVPLPVELALGERCAIVEAVARAPAPLVELCGTWIGGRYRGSELVEAITRAALDVARALGARQIVGCAHQHILAFYQRFGAEVDPELGVHPYPDARYETRVFWAAPERCVGGGLRRTGPEDPGERRGTAPACPLQQVWSGAVHDRPQRGSVTERQQTPRTRYLGPSCFEGGAHEDGERDRGDARAHLGWAGGDRDGRSLGITHPPALSLPRWSWFGNYLRPLGGSKGPMPLHVDAVKVDLRLGVAGRGVWWTTTTT